ncbi:palmitoyltransferase for Vac8p [Salix suchowensis]|nr:palmitoyltransferase for Vac8p [Salix suchowensis]
MPLVTLDYQDASTRILSPVVPQADRSKTFVDYLPLGAGALTTRYLATVFLLLAPHPSVIFVVVKYHLLTLEEPLLLFVHLAAIYAFSFLAFSSLIVCVARDPGPVNSVDEAGRGLMMSTVSDDVDFNGPGKWCRECWPCKADQARRHRNPNAHTTARTVGGVSLKWVTSISSFPPTPPSSPSSPPPDHHCPWLGARCIVSVANIRWSASPIFKTVAGPQNVPGVCSLPDMCDAACDVHRIHERLRALVCVQQRARDRELLGLSATRTNQTTIENLSPFMLLRHLPPLPASNNAGRTLSDPPSEHELTYEQRYIVREAHGAIRLYDIGLRRNWAQVFGWERRWGWVPRLLHGGGSRFVPPHGMTVARDDAIRVWRFKSSPFRLTPPSLRLPETMVNEHAVLQAAMVSNCTSPFFYDRRPLSRTLGPIALGGNAFMYGRSSIRPAHNVTNLYPKFVIHTGVYYRKTCAQWLHVAVSKDYKALFKSIV